MTNPAPDIRPASTGHRDRTQLRRMSPVLGLTAAAALIFAPLTSASAATPPPAPSPSATGPAARPDQDTVATRTTSPAASPTTTTPPPKPAAPKPPAKPTPRTPTGPVPPSRVGARGEVTAPATAGIRVTDIKLVGNGRAISAIVRWNRALIALPGNHDQFRIRLTGFPANSNRPVTFGQLAFNRVPAAVQRVTLPLTPVKLRQLRAAADVVLSASQHYDGPDRNASFERTHVATTHLNTLLRPRPRSAGVGGRITATAALALRDCTGVLIGPGADLRRCDLRGAQLQGVNLTNALLQRADFIGTNLSGAVFTGAQVNGAFFGGATGVNLAGAIGIPAAAGATPANPNPSPAGPRVTSISPPSGPVAGGTTVTIVGTGFVPGASVTVGGVPCSDSAWKNPTTLRCTTGAHALGAADVVVTNPSNAETGTLSAGFTYTKGAHLFWAGALGDSAWLGRADIEGSNPNNSFVNVNPNGGSWAQDVATDGTYLYWADMNGNQIGRSNLDGSGVNSGFITGLYQPTGVAVQDGQIFWATSGAIGVANLDGSNVNQGLVQTNTDVQNVNGGWDVAVDDQFVYWTNNQDSNENANAGTTIGRANLDGSNANPNFINNAFGPRGLAVDGGHLYWTNTADPNVNGQSQFSIGLANLDGSNANATWLTGMPSVQAMTVDGGYVYWVDVVSNSIGRAATDGSGINTTWLAAVQNLQGVGTDLTPFPKSLSTTSGSEAGGTEVTIAGFGFDPAATVTIGGVDCPRYTGSWTTITCVTGAAPAGAADVVVTNPRSQAGLLPQAFTFQSGPPPTLSISGITPVSGSALGGTPVTISGAGFLPGTTISVGGSACRNPIVSSASQLTCVTSAHQPGPADVVVTNPQGPGPAGTANLAAGYTFVQSPPTVTQISPAAGNVAGGTQVIVTGTHFAPQATVTIGGVPCARLVVVALTSLTCSTGAHATGPADVVVTNPDGSTGTLPAGFSYNYAPPVVQSISPTAVLSTGGVPLTITGNGFLQGATVALNYNNGTGGPNRTGDCAITQIASASITCTMAPNFGVGVQADVVVTNPNGKQTTLSQALTLNPNTTPTITAVQPNSGPVTGDTPVTVTGSGFYGNSESTGLTVSIAGQPCTITGAVQADTLTCTTGSNNFNSATGGPGPFDVSVATTFQFASGSQATGNATLPAGYTYLNTPLLTSVSPAVGWTMGGSQLTLTGAAIVDGATITVGGIPCTDPTDVSPQADPDAAIASVWTCVTGGHGPGPVDVVVTNPDGITSTLPGGYGYQDPDVQLTGISPATGSTLGGTPVTISGSDLVDGRAGSSVKVGGSPCVNATWSGNSITCTTTGPQPAGPVDVSVNDASGRSDTLPQSFTFAEVAPQVLTTSPNQGSVTGGTTVTVAGTGFEQGAIVTVGGYTCDVGAITAQSLTCATHAHPAGTVDVTVTNPSGLFGTLTDGFTFAMQVTGMNPSSVSTLGGAPLQLTGGGFAQGATVSIGGQSCEDPAITPTAISCTTPGLAVGQYPVVVTNTNGQTSQWSSPLAAAIPTPTVTGVSPPSGSNLGGATVTVAGTGFYDATTVQIGGSDCANVEISNQTSLTCQTTGYHPTGTVDVVVTNPGNPSGTLAGSYSFLAATPNVVSVSPTSGAVAGSTQVTITGTNFDPAATATIGGAQCANPSVSADFSQLSCSTGVSEAAGPADVVVTNPTWKSDTGSGLYTFTANRHLFYGNVGSVPYYGGGTIGNLGRAKLDGSEADPNYIDVNPGVTDPTQQVEDSNPVASGGFVYYITGNGSVGRVGLDGSDLNNNWISGATYPGVESQLALDAQYIYVTNQNNGNGAIGRFNLTDGSQAGFGSTTGDQFISGLNTPSAVAVSGGAIYWGDSGTGQIGSALLPAADDTSNGPGSISTSLFTVFSPDSTQAEFTAMAVGWVSELNTDGGLYWSLSTMTGTNSSTASIGIAPITPGSPGTIFTVITNTSLISGLGMANGLAADGQYLYWTGTNNVERADLSSGSLFNDNLPLTVDRNFITNTVSPDGVAVVPEPSAADTPAISQFSANSPQVGPATGGTVVTLQGSGFLANSRITFGGLPCPLLTTATNTATSLTCVTPAHPAGSVDVVVANLNGQTTVVSSGFNYLAASYLYWVDTSTGSATIARSNLDGTGINPTFAAADCGGAPNCTTVPGMAPSSLAVDDNNVYWINAAPGDDSTAASIGSIGLDGSNPNNNLIPNVDNSSLDGGVIAAGGGRIYWINCNDPEDFACTQTIGAADMDGKNVNYSFIQTTGVAGGITSLAADSSGIYWADGDGTGQVMWADLNGQNINATYLPANVTAYSDTTYDDSGGEIDHDVMTKHVSISNGQIYWAGSGIENTYLGSATIGASGPTNIVYPLQTFADGGTAQLTANAQRLYWWSPNQNGGNSTGMSTIGGVTINPSIMTDTGAPVVSPSALSAPPQVTTVSPVGGSTLGGTLVTISGTGFQQATNTVTIGGVPCANVTPSSPTSLTCTTGVHTAGPIDYGPADVTVTNPDTQSGTLTGGYDYSPPTPTIGAVNPGSALFLGGQQIAINGAGFDPNLTVMLGNTPCSIAPGNVTPTTITCTPGNNQVEQVVDVVVNNGDGKLATKARGFTFAGYAPTAAPQSPLTPTTAPLNGGTILTITGGYFDQNAQITVGGSPCPQISGGSGQGSPNSTLLCQLPAGTAVGPATVVVANPDGQRISLPGADSTATFSYGPPNPSISSVTTAAGESFGSTGGNYRVTVAGTSFGQNPSVMVGAQPCVNPVLAGSTVSCRVRPHSAGPVDVVVTRADGQSAVLTRGFTFVVETPTLTSISPAAGSSTGGTPVTVSGTGFDPAATVSLGGAICGQVQVTGQASLSCVTGGDMVGPADLVVTNPGDLSATLPGAFTYGGWGPGPSPQPLSITPSAGTPGGGESVTISGNFLGVVPTDVTVTIGGVGCQVTTTTGSSLNCTTGPHPLGVGDVVVTAVVNLATGTLPQSFTYATVVPPTVTSISPSEGTFLGRTPVTITGTGFMAGADVKIGTAICRNPQVTSPTTVTCTTGRSQLSPDSSALAAKVVVTNSDQQASTDPVTYRYTPGGNLFWPNGGASPQSIGQAAVGNTGTDHSYTLPSGVGMLGGIAADDRYVYWADQLNASIGRVPIDDLAGEQAQPKWIDLSSVSATPMSVSVSGGYIYWADSSNDQIGRATLANPGSTVAYNFVSGNALNSPYGVAVDNAYIYWANHGDSTLARAYLANGSLPTAIHTVSNGHNPSGVTVRGGQLYWTAQTAAGTGGSLGRANPDGSNPTDSFVGNTGAGNVASFNSPQGLAAAGSTLFWANSGGTSLGAANLADGSSPDGNLIVGANAPQGVAVN